MSVSIHAAATDTEWHGTDFISTQAGFAKELADSSGAGLNLYDDSFAEFANRTDLPDFDYIGLHGIWSWISDENRSIIVNFIHKKLKIGGVLYLSYNTMPGWAAFAPMQHLFRLHNDHNGRPGESLVTRIDEAIVFVDKLLDTIPEYAKANPLIKEKVQKLKDQNRNYLAHEYFNQNWNPMHFKETLNWLKKAKLDYACSANYLHHIDALNLTTEQVEFLNHINDVMFRQSVKDFMVNQGFRKDYWVKGARRLSVMEQTEGIRQQKVILTTNRMDVCLNISGALGEASMSETIYNPILNVLADNKPKTIAQIELAVNDKGIKWPQITEAIMVLASAGYVAAVQEDALISKRKMHTDRLNNFIINKARSNSDILWLASPVIGGGVVVGRFHQLFLLAIRHGKKKPEEQAEVAWQILNAQGQKMLKDGKSLDKAEDNLVELKKRASIFAEKYLPVLKALQVI